MHVVLFIWKLQFHEMKFTWIIQINMMWIKPNVPFVKYSCAGLTYAHQYPLGKYRLMVMNFCICKSRWVKQSLLTVFLLIVENWDWGTEQLQTFSGFDVFATTSKEVTLDILPFAALFLHNTSWWWHTQWVLVRTWNESLIRGAEIIMVETTFNFRSTSCHMLSTSKKTNITFIYFS